MTPDVQERHAAVLAMIDAGELTYATIAKRFGISGRMVLKIADKAGRPRRGRGRRLPCAYDGCTSTHYEGTEYCFDHLPSTRDYNRQRDKTRERHRSDAGARVPRMATTVERATLQRLTRRVARMSQSFPCVRCGGDTGGAAMFCAACRA